MIRRYLTDAKAAAVSDAKGKLYEELLIYLFEAVPGCIAEHNLTNVFRTEQIDVRLAMPGIMAVCAFAARNPCGVKDRGKPVNSTTVGYLINILAGRGVGLGILVVANGITGDRDDLTNAHALGLHGSPRAIKIVVITTEDIASLQSVDDFVGCFTGGTSGHSLLELSGFHRSPGSSPTGSTPFPRPVRITMYTGLIQTYVASTDLMRLALFFELREQPAATPRPPCHSFTPGGLRCRRAARPQLQQAPREGCSAVGSQEGSEVVSELQHLMNDLSFRLKSHVRCTRTSSTSRIRRSSARGSR